MLEILQAISLEGWILQAVAMVVTAILIPGLKVTSIFGPFLAVISLAFVNSQLWSTALFFQVPDSLTLHTLSLVGVNGVIFWVLVKLLPGIEVKGILPAFAAPIVFSLASLLIYTFGRDIEWQPLFDQAISLLSQLRSYFLETAPVDPGS